MRSLGSLLRCSAAGLVADEAGNIAILFALLLALSTVAGAFAVDEGALYLQRRQAQSVVDLASIAAAPDPADGFARARKILVDSGLVSGTISDADLSSGSHGVKLSVDSGSYAADPSLPVASRFSAGGSSPNAARVRLLLPGAIYFAQTWKKTSPEIGVEAIGSVTPSVMFSIGSTLAQLSDGVPNAVLNALLGANVSLTAVSYNGLLSARVSLFGFLDAMAQELNISAGTYNDVLAASADQGTIARALADCLTGANAAAARSLAGSLGHNGTVPLSKLFNLGQAGGLAIGTGSNAGDYATVSALEMLGASGAVSDGTHQVDLALAASVPGLTSLTMSLAVGEPQQFAAWFALGPSGSLVRTAQVRLKFVATIGGGAALLNASIRIPLYLELAYAQAGVASAACPIDGATTGSAVIDAQPGVASLSLGDVGSAGFDDFSGSPVIAPATLVNAVLLRITGAANATIGQISPTALSFSPADIDAGTVQRATTTDFTQSLTTSLLSSLTLNVSAFGLGLPSVSGIKSLIAGLVSPLGPVLDSTIAATLNTLGLTLGAADVEVYGVTCQHAVLVG